MGPKWQFPGAGGTDQNRSCVETRESEALFPGSTESNSDEAVWTHKEYYAPIRKQQRFQAPVRQEGSRARKYVFQANTQGQGSFAEEQGRDKALNDGSGRDGAGTQAMHSRHGQHPWLSD